MTNFFKEQREALGLTQRDVSIALNMTTSAVGAWENEITAPRIGIAAELAAVYKVTEARILKEISALSQRVIAAKSKKSGQALSAH